MPVRIPEVSLVRLISVLVDLGAPGLARSSISLITGGALAEAEVALGKRQLAPLIQVAVSCIAAGRLGT